MNSKIIWFILGGVGLVAVGFLIGISLSTGEWAACNPRLVSYGSLRQPWEGHMMQPWGNPTMNNWRLLGPFLGWGWPWMVLLWLGPLLGIAALIIALTRRQAPQPPTE